MPFSVLYHYLFTFLCPICNHAGSKWVPKSQQLNLVFLIQNDFLVVRLKLEVEGGKNRKKRDTNDQREQTHAGDSTSDPAPIQLKKGFVWCHHLRVLLLLDLSQCLWDFPWRRGRRGFNGRGVNTMCTLHFNGIPFSNMDLFVNHYFEII